MTNSLSSFKKSLESINVIDSLYLYLQKQMQGQDLSELLRAEFVLIVSAFDYYIHDVVREGMLKIFDRAATPNEKYLAFGISIEVVELLITNNDPVVRRQMLDQEIRKVTSKWSYQSPQSVEKALGLIDFRSVWSDLSVDLSMPPIDVKSTLGLIVDRRNKIAHESDIDSITLQKTPIDHVIVTQAKEFVLGIVEACDKRL